MKLDDLFIKIRDLQYQDQTVQMGTTVSASLRGALSRMAASKNMKMRQVLDMAIYHFLAEAGHEFKDFEPAKDKEKEKDHIGQCSNCFFVYNTAKGDGCPQCKHKDLFGE